MGYRITYEQNMKKTELPAAHSTFHLKRWIYSAIICIVLAIILSSSTVRRFLLPGDPYVTENALSELAEDLREGESVSDAVTAFCREILENA